MGASLCEAKLQLTLEFQYLWNHSSHIQSLKCFSNDRNDGYFPIFIWILDGVFLMYKIINYQLINVHRIRIYFAIQRHGLCGHYFILNSIDSAVSDFTELIKSLNLNISKLPKVNIRPFCMYLSTSRCVLKKCSCKSNNYWPRYSILKDFRCFGQYTSEW
jgi:hypothetical protein